MSSPSTPRSTRSASPAGTSPNIMTPGQKIRAMLAAFDSDLEEDNCRIPESTSALSKLNLGRDTMPTAETRENGATHDSEYSDSADEMIRPKGRMAARLQGNVTSAGSKDEDSAFARVSKAIRSERTQAEKPQQIEPETEPTPNYESSDDDLPTAGRRQKNITSSSPKYNDRTSQTPPPARAYSPLFVSSPSQPDHDADIQHESVEYSDTEKPKGNPRFMALVAQKRKEREEREKEEKEKRAAKKAARRAENEHWSGESGSDIPHSASRLSQKARQPRKASKKAMEEMRQETQRMSRNMQLAHQAQTKKKITKQSLFARFGFMQPDTPAEQPAGSSSVAANSQNSSDGELRTNTKDTPHTSPLAGHAETHKETIESEHVQGEAADVDMDAEMEPLPLPSDLMVFKDKAELAEEPAAQEDPTAAPKDKVEGTTAKKVSHPLTQPPIRVLLSRREVAAHQRDSDDSDSDLEVVTSPGKCRRIAAFENLKTRQMQEDPSMTKLKALAHLTSPTRKAASMNSAELSADLLRRARQQAAKERRERIEELRAKGVVIETAEERAAMEDDMENLVDKARKEAEEIRRLEKAARKDNGDDDDEDNDYELSGSEEEVDKEAADEDDADDEDDENDSINGDGGLVDQEADEEDDSETAASDVEGEVPVARRKRPTRVVSDGEDEDEDQQQPPSTPMRAPTLVPQSAERPKFPGMRTSGDMSLGLTQAFASTLDGNGLGTPASTIPFSLPDPGRPVPQLQKQESEVLVPDSQPQPQDKDFREGYTQSTVTRVSESPAPYAFSEYSHSQLPDPTQDEGFVFSPFDPAKRFRDTPPASTVDTVLIGQSQSPIADRKRKMLRRGRVSELPLVDEGDSEGDFEVDANAFNVMKKAASKKNAAPRYDKKSSKAKDIVDEAAEESEDEYAGLGGISDESDGEENAIDRQMINDNSGEVVDEKELAALNAIHDRNRDEKDVAKLMRDITTGALRRRKNADDDFDLDDSDDELLARRRQKQREFAKMRRALLADEKVGELAENPKKAAFFRAVEDREFDDDFNIDFLEESEGTSQAEASQDATGTEDHNSASDFHKRKRPLEPSAEDATNRPPPHLRRTPASAMSKKPATLAEIRETLSFLTETHEYESFQEAASLDADEDQDQDQDNEDFDHSAEATETDQPQETFIKPQNPRRTRGVVVDRLALLRQASSNSATTSTTSANSKLAFYSGSGGEGPIGFRPPQLLRRVTSGSSSSASSSSSRVSKAAASGPKKGGAVNSYTAAREREREKELRIKERGGGSNIAKLLGKHTGGGLTALDKGQWD